MKIIKKGQKEEPILTQENRFIEISHEWYEVLSIYIDVITEKVVINMNKGYFDEEENFIKEIGYRGTIENKEGKITSIKEKLNVDKNYRIKTSFKIINPDDALIFNDQNKRIKYFKKIDDHTLEFKKLKSNKIDIKYKSQEEVKDGYNRFMREATSEKNSGNVIISSIRKAAISGDIKYEAK